MRNAAVEIKKLPAVNLSLIVSFVVIYAVGAEKGSIFVSLSFSPSLFFDRLAFWRVISYAFLHYDFFHLATNAVFIYIFGNDLEMEIGHRQYFLLFITASAASVLFYSFFNSNSSIPIIGASGAISAIVAGYIYYFAAQKIRHFRLDPFVHHFSRIFILLFVAIWFVIQYIDSIIAFTDKTDAGWLIHVGGFMYGLLFSAIFSRKY